MDAGKKHINRVDRVEDIKKGYTLYCTQSWASKIFSQFCRNYLAKLNMLTDGLGALPTLHRIDPDYEGLNNLPFITAY